MQLLYNIFLNLTYLLSVLSLLIVLNPNQQILNKAMAKIPVSLTTLMSWVAMKFRSRMKGTETAQNNRNKRTPHHYYNPHPV